MYAYEVTNEDMQFIEDTITKLQLEKFNEVKGNNSTNKFLNPQVLEFFINKWDEDS